MSEQKESSVLFSLKELMNLEEDRIKAEEDDRRRSAEEAERARLHAEQAAREAEEARLRAEEERRRLDESRTNEEAARLEAIRQAEVEKARLDAEQRARMEAMAAQQAQERQLAEIKNDESKRKLRNMLIGGGAVATLVLGLGGWFAYSSYQQYQLDIAKQEEISRQLEAEKAALSKQLTEGRDRISSLESDFANAKDEAERAKLQKRLDEAKAEQQALQQQMGKVGGPRPAGGDKPAAKPVCNCDPNDPLCDC
jgi:colicin import membrane protein